METKTKEKNIEISTVFQIKKDSARFHTLTKRWQKSKIQAFDKREEIAHQRG